MELGLSGSQEAGHGLQGPFPPSRRCSHLPQLLSTRLAPHFSFILLILSFPYPPLQEQSDKISPPDPRACLPFVS